MSAAADLKRTPLYELHVALGAKMVPFAGYEMPVNYPDGILAEHRQCRSAAALFDVSHMGQLRLAGDDAARALETLVPVDVVDLGVNKQRYALFTNAQGGILDDLMITRREHDLMLVVNAACKDADTRHLITNLGTRCNVIPMPERALLALQGPKAATALSRLNPDAARLVFMTGTELPLCGAACFVTRSGYTGEDGFEISVPAEDAVTLAKALPGRTRHAAPGGGPVPLRPRHRRQDHAGRGRPHVGNPEGAAPRRRARRPLPRCGDDRGAARHRAGDQARRPGRPRAHAGARRRGHLRCARPQAGPRHQRHHRPDGEPADRDGLPRSQPRVAAQRGASRGARQALSDAGEPDAVRPPPLLQRLNASPGETPMTTMFTADHEWINIENHEAAVVGITQHAQEALGDVVFVDLPEVGRSYKRGEVAGVVESVKAAADLYMPVDGEIVAVNEALRKDPALVNRDPMGAGWFFTVRVAHMEQFDELMDPPAYDKLLQTL